MNHNTETAKAPAETHYSNEFDKLLQAEYMPRQPDIIFDDGAFARIERIAKLMAAGHSTVPKHLRGNVTDCFAVAMQAHMWGMNAFNVAQKTHEVNGILGYEAQLVNAVVTSCGAVEGRFHYEFAGDGQDLKCRVGAKITGELEITWGEWLRIGDITTRNSPLWKTNPKQQLGYLQVKNWARMYVPGAIMGVYSDDELVAPESMDRISRVDLTTPASDADDVIKRIDACIDLAELELLRPAVAVLSGEALKLARGAYTAAKKALTPAAAPAENQSQYADLSEVMASISSITNAATRDAAKAMIEKLSEADKLTASKAYENRVKAVKQEAENKQKYADYLAAIDGSSSTDELDAHISGMPQEAFEAFRAQIDKKRELLSSNEKDPFEFE